MRLLIMMLLLALTPVWALGWHDNDAQCRVLWKSCPHNGVFPEPSCVEKVMASHAKICGPLNQLSKQLQTFPYLLTVKEVSHFKVIDQLFPADGQHVYYLLTPNGSLIKTVIDPRKLNAALAKQYRKTHFMVVNKSEPQFQQEQNGTQNFVVPLQIMDTCLACAEIGVAVIKYQFDQHNQLQRMTLERFIPSPQTSK